ncbi:hypothetical protein MAUB1S_00079 [Mycolicibacterium aubagnense]
MLVAWHNRCVPLLVAHVVHRIESVRRGLVWSEQSEVAVAGVTHHDFAQILPEHPGRLGSGVSRLHGGHGKFLGGRQMQRREQEAAVGIWVQPHLVIGLRDVIGHQRCRATHLIEQLIGPIRREPIDELPAVFRISPDVGDGHLMGAPRALHRQTVNPLRSGPTLGCTQHQHGPLGSRRWRRSRPRNALDLAHQGYRLVERGGHVLVHPVRVVTGDVDRVMPVSA